MQQYTSNASEWNTRTKRKHKNEWNEERMNESSSCLTNKRIYNHANNVNLLLHKFYENIFFDDKERIQQEKNGKYQQHNRKPNMRYSSRNKKKTNQKITTTKEIHVTFRMHMQTPIYFVIHFRNTIVYVSLSFIKHR